MDTRKLKAGVATAALARAGVPVGKAPDRSVLVGNGELGAVTEQKPRLPVGGFKP